MNMSYCRFENTLGDLRDCSENIWDEDLSETETASRRRLVQLCKDIVEECGDDFDEE